MTSVPVNTASVSEGGAGYSGDLAGAGGDVLEGPPSLGEQGEPAFSEAAQGALEGVAGPVAEVEFADDAVGQLDVKRSGECPGRRSR